MVETGFRKPNNGVLLDPKGNATTMYHNVGTAANVKPGRLVKRGSTDDDVVVNTASNLATGWAGYEKTPAAFKPATRDTGYALNDRIAVHSGGGFMVRAMLAVGTNCTKGNRLGASDSSGCVTVDASGEIAIAEETVNAGNDAVAIWVRSLI